MRFHLQWGLGLGLRDVVQCTPKSRQARIETGESGAVEWGLMHYG